MMNLENKKIIITGATGGIGNSIVKRLSDAGAKNISHWHKT
jgi:NAD(P)-dependent dehydrogenase (short-subunit alcohol dehydrogenase family)